jgi:hypothetical protein
VAMKSSSFRIRFKGLKGAAKGKRRWIAALGLAAAIVAVGYFLWVRTQSANPDSLVRIDRPLPPFVVASSDAAVDLRTFAAGDRRVIVFYSPSCSVCKEVLPALHPFPSNLRLILVKESLDPNDSDISSLPAAALFHDRWRVLSRALTAASLPTLLFVDGRGVLRDGLVGRHERFMIQRKLKEFAVQ